MRACARIFEVSVEREEGIRKMREKLSEQAVFGISHEG